MTRHLAAISSLLLLSASLAIFGCGTPSAPAAKGTSDGKGHRQAPSAGERLAGQWQGSFVVDEEGVKGLPPAQVERLRQMQLGMEFWADGKLIVSAIDARGNTDQSEGTWQLVKEEGNDITIKTVEASGKEKEAFLMFESNDAFMMPLQTEVANLGAMRFERLR